MNKKKLFMLVGVLGASFSSLFVRSSTAPSLILVVYRSFFSMLLLGPYALLCHRQEVLSIKRKELLLAVGSGVFLGFHFTAYFEALQWTSIAAAVVLVDTSVFFVALAGVLLLRQKPSRRAWVAIALTFLGSVVVALANNTAGADPLRGNLIALLGSLVMAVYTMLGAVCRRTVSNTVYTFWAYLSSLVTVLICALVSATPLTGYGPVNYLTGFGMAVCCTLLGHSVFNWGLKYLPAAFISTLKLMEPVLAALWGLLLFSEQPGPTVILGSCVIIFGIALYNTNKE